MGISENAFHTGSGEASFAIAHREISHNGVSLLSKPSKHQIIANVGVARGAIEVSFNHFFLHATFFQVHFRWNTRQNSIGDTWKKYL